MAERAPRKTNEELNHAIFQATIDLLNNEGYENVTFNNVAKAAGTGRPVLYRRWDSPFDLILEAEDYFSTDEIDSYDEIDFSGHTMRENLIDSLGHFNASPQFMRAFLFELGRETPSVKKFFNDMRKQNLYIMERLLSQAQLAGEINHTVTDDVKLMPINLLLYQAMIDQNEVSAAFVANLVDHVVIPAIMAQQND